MLSDILIEFTIFFLNELFKVHLPVSLWDSCFSFDFDNTVGEDEVCHTLIYNLFSGEHPHSPVTQKGLQAVILNVNKSSREGY